VSARPRESRVIRTAAGVLAFLIVAVGATVLLRASAGTAASPTPGESPTSGTPPLELHQAPGATFVPTVDGKRSIYVLVIGSDARPGQGIDQERADSIHIISLNPKAGKATILGIPRDSWVSIPGHGMDKINASLFDGGPALTVKTVEQLTGIHFDYYAITSFGGLVRMVQSLGGVTVRVRQSMHDPYSRSNFEPGVHHFNGVQALEYARDRHSFAGGDFTRSQNQGTLMLAALARFKKLFKENPLRLLPVLASTWNNVRTDVPAPQLYRLALTASQIDPHDVSNLVVPASTGMEGSASVVFISPEAKALYTQLRKKGYIAR
jgi:polyisoprenyl-teichoic acid--peptidoglycan teichoic acid transferase